MINRTNIVIPKKYEGYIEKIYKNADCYYCNLLVGYSVSEDANKIIHFINEHSQKELLNKIRNIEECHCKKCNQNYQKR